MTPDPFEPGLIERLTSQYPDRDVEAIAQDVIALGSRQQVRNPSGLLIARCRRAEHDNSWRRGVAQEQAPNPEAELWRGYQEHRRYAIAFVHALTLARNFSPADVAELLEAYRKLDGYDRLNPLTAELLRSLGHTWPDSDDVRFGTAMHDSESAA